MIQIRKVLSMTGVLLMFIAAMMCIPFIISFFYNDGDSKALLYSILCAASVGIILYYQGRKEKEINIKSGFAVVAIGWIAMALAGALPYYFSGSIPALTDCIFESMSGFTTTGATILSADIKIERLPHGVLFWRSLTHWIGGMGIILLSIAIMPLLGVGGMQLYRAEFPGPVKDKITPRVRTTAEILWFVYVLISLLEFILLLLGGLNAFDAACHTFGTMATGGFSTHSESIGFYDSQFVHYVVIIFMFIAGVNFSLHYRFLRGKFGNYWQSREFRFYLILISVFTVLIFMNNYIRSEYNGLEATFRQSLFHVTSIITTTGYGASDWEKWGGFAQILMVAMMFTGGMAGSTGGGVKVVRIQIMIHQILNELKRLVHPHAVLPIKIGRVLVDESIIRNVLAFLLTFGLILLISTAVMSSLGIDIVTSFGASIACLSNIGPGLGSVGAIDNYSHIPLIGKWLLILLMMLGRLEIFTVLILFNRHFWRK